MKETLIRLREVMKITGFGRSQIYKLINIGEFPKQIQIRPGSVAWLESELETWMKERIRLSRDDDTQGQGYHLPRAQLHGTPSAVFI